MLRKNLLLVLLATATPAMADPSAYLCIPEGSVGFKYNAGDSKWEPTSFATPERYVLRPVDIDGQDKPNKYLLAKDGRPPENTWALFNENDSSGHKLLPRAVCQKQSGTFVFEEFNCTEILNAIEFNENTSKFVMHSNGSYLSAISKDQTPPDAPTTVIGRCEPYYIKP